MFSFASSHLLTFPLGRRAFHFHLTPIARRQTLLPASCLTCASRNRTLSLVSIASQMSRPKERLPYTTGISSNHIRGCRMGTQLSGLESSSIFGWFTHTQITKSINISMYQSNASMYFMYESKTFICFMYCLNMFSSSPEVQSRTQTCMTASGPLRPRWFPAGFSLRCFRIGLSGTRQENQVQNKQNTLNFGI